MPLCDPGEARTVAFWTVVYAAYALFLCLAWGKTIWYVHHFSVAFLIFLIAYQIHALVVDRWRLVRGRALTALAAATPLYIGREMGQYSCLHDMPTAFDYPGLLVPVLGVLAVFVVVVAWDAAQEHDGGAIAAVSTRAFEHGRL
jgi:hypothetical protein